MRDKKFEFIVSLFIIAGVISLFFLVFKVSNTSIETISKKGYNISAEFKDIGGLRENSSVKISGVEIGKVDKINLKKSYNGFIANVKMHISSDAKIPANYMASIEMSGILGDNYIALSPSKNNVLSIIGDDDKKDSLLHEGSVISLENTESALNLGSLVNTFVASKDDDDK